MNFFKTDQFFEEAGRSVESCEKLIKRLRRNRLHGLIVFFGTGVVSLGFCVWGFVLAVRVLHSIGETTPSSPHTDLPFDATLVHMLTPIVLVSLITQFIWIQHHDACIKMLLILRAQQGLSSRRDVGN